jgi:hypothetical protein
MQLTPLREFLLHEAVGWKDTDGCYRYGEVAKVERKTGIVESGKGTNSKSQMAHEGIVAQLTLRLTESRVAVLPASDVYSFKSNMNQEESLAPAKSGPHDELKTYEADERDSGEGTLRSMLHDNEADSAEVHKGQPGANSEKSAVLGAVVSLLSRANVPLSLAQRDLVAANLKLQAELKEETDEVDRFRQQKAGLMSQVSPMTVVVQHTFASRWSSFKVRSSAKYASIARSTSLWCDAVIWYCDLPSFARP